MGLENMPMLVQWVVPGAAYVAPADVFSSAIVPPFEGTVRVTVAISAAQTLILRMGATPVSLSMNKGEALSADQIYVFSFGVTKSDVFNFRFGGNCTIRYMLVEYSQGVHTSQLGTRASGVGGGSTMRNINFSIDGGGAVIAAGMKGEFITKEQLVIDYLALIGQPAAGTLAITLAQTLLSAYPAGFANFASNPALAASQLNEVDLSATPIVVPANSVIRVTVAAAPAPAVITLAGVCLRART